MDIIQARLKQIVDTALADMLSKNICSPEIDPKGRPQKIFMGVARLCTPVDLV